MSFVQIHPKIRALDTMMHHHCGGDVLSLNPQKYICTSYEVLFEHFRNIQSLHLHTFIDSITILVKKELLHFPNNIFWDKDYILIYLLEQICQFPSNEQEMFLSEYVHTYISLLELFGKCSSIRFQYLHDFSYGFDWAKWVRNDSEHRKEILPFSLPFLQRMFQRGKELELLIQNNDSMYPRLHDEKFRNPFQFHRSIECESRLLRQLAKKNQIPIVAWETHGSIDWKKNYSELRDIEAKNSGLST